MKRTWFCSLALLLGFAANLQAAQIVVDPVGATASSSYPNRSAGSTIDSSGLDPGPANVLAKNANEIPEPNVMWLTNGTPTGTITFDLGANYWVASAFVWNYSEVAFSNGASFTSRGARSVDVYASATDTNPSLPSEFVGNIQLSQANPAPSTTFGGGANWGLDYNTPGVNYNLPTSAYGARYIRFDILSNFGDGFLGLDEVRFIALPEPSSLVLAGLAAVGLAGYSLKRRRRNG